MARSVTHIDNVGSSSPSLSKNSYSHSGSHSGNSHPAHVRHHMPANVDEYDYLCKLLVIGDSGCGKSSLLTRFADDEFHTGYSSTIGVDFSVRSIEVQTERGQKKVVKLQMWDTAGQERFRTITSAYYRGAHAVIVVCDVTSEDSFANVRRWMQELDAVSTRGEGGKASAGDQHSHDHPSTRSAHVLLVANKVDLHRSRVVEPHRIAALAAELGISFVESSAKSGSGVAEAFHSVAERFVAQRMNEEREGRWQADSHASGGMHGGKGLRVVNGRRVDGYDDDDDEQSGWRKCAGACSIM